MRINWVIILVMVAVQSLAQTPDSRGIYVGDMLEDVDMGWMNTITIKEPSKPFAQHGWSYTATQTDASQRIGTWIQQTFTQRGLLGELKLSVLAPEPSYPMTSKYYGYNEAEKNNRNALPNTYGAFAKFHKCISKTATKKFWPTPGNHCYMGLDIMINNVQLISKQVIGLSSTDEYYCFMPKYAPGIKGRFDKEWMPAALAYRNFDKSPNLKNYEHYVLPAKSIDANPNTYVIIMTKDNKPLPFEQVTMGELIARLELQFPMIQKMAANSGVSARLPNLLEDAKRGFQIFKNRFKNQLNEYAYGTDLNHNIDLFSFSQIEEGKEIYWIKTTAKTVGKNGYEETNFPLLRLKRGVKQSLATGPPQWIVFKLDEPIGAGYSGNVQMMDNFVNRFNYDYVYRYFFGKDKVTEPYKPLGAVNAEEKKQAVAPTELSAAAKKNATDRSILFFEDFSGTAIGAAPKGWTTQRSEITGDQVAVTKLEKADGNWLRLKRNATPTNFPQNIKGDFEMSYDLLVHKGDVPWGTPGIDVQLKFSGSAGEKNVTLNVSPGDMNRADAAGWVIINGLSTCKVSNYYSISEFTGSKPVNKVTISLRKKGESILIMCNNNKVYECATAFTPGMICKGLNFYVNEKSQFYISNIKITLAKAQQSGNSFSTTTFDDGWISSIKEDWVEVSKPGIRILIHYPNQQTDEHQFEKLKGDQNAWDILVAGRYIAIQGLQERGIQDFQSVTFLTADATEKQTGKKVFVVLYKKHYDNGNGRYLEVVADSKAVFEKEFGSNYINRSSWDYLEQTKSWDKLAAMQWRNKFSVAGNDLTGKWSSSSYASLRYYYVSGGGFAGATATSIADLFTFSGDNTYESDHSGASGVVGNQKFTRQTYKGTIAIKSWSITLTNRFQGASETYESYFEAIRGGKILQLMDRNNTMLSLVKVQ